MEVKLPQTRPDGQTWEFDETRDLLLHATRILDNFNWPDIEGIEYHKGNMIHTARYLSAYQHSLPTGSHS